MDEISFMWPWLCSGHPACVCCAAVPGMYGRMRISLICISESCRAEGLFLSSARNFSFSIDFSFNFPPNLLHRYKCTENTFKYWALQLSKQTINPHLDVESMLVMPDGF